MSFLKVYKREILACTLCITLGAGFSTLLHLALVNTRVVEAEPLKPAEEKVDMRKTASIQSPISVVELWEVASSKSLCIVAVNINRDQNVQSKLYAAQVAMNCMQPK